MSNRLPSLLRKVAQRSNLRYLHYKPTEGREREPIREPQKIEAYYEYIYERDFYPETYGNANDQHAGDAYTNAMLYDWDNYQFKYEGEWYDYGPISFYVIAFSFPFLLSFFIYSVDRKEHANDGNYFGASNLNREYVFYKPIKI